MSVAIIVRFTDVSSQPTHPLQDDPIKRLVGFVQAKNLIPLFDHAGLAANPRSSKRNSIVSDILDTLESSPELFRFKSKGILIGTSKYSELERNRFRLEFEDPEIEGILDGGHNMLGIGLFMLRPHMDEREWSKLKSWDDMKSAWDAHRTEIENHKEDYDFLVSVELLVPASLTNGDRDQFLMPLLEVCEARNNNFSLPITARSNKQGFYAAMQAEMPSEIRERVEWKPNTWEGEARRPIKVQDLEAKAWIPLNLLAEAGMLPGNIRITPQNTYRNKAECSKKFEELMSLDAVTTAQEGSRRLLTNRTVASAFRVLSEIPYLSDKIYRDFPDAYNKGNRRFAANPIVKLYDPIRRKQAVEAGKDAKGYIASQPKTPYYREDTKYSYPEGLIAPLIYGLQGLMVVEGNEVRWAISDISGFLDRNLAPIAESYQLVMNIAKWDPQKISKDPASYEFAIELFRQKLASERASQ
jgi:hypothetical protein